MATLADILARRWPGARWQVHGDDHATLLWLSAGSPPAEAEIRAWSAAIDEEIAWEAVRAERNRRLAASDFTQLADAPVDSLHWAVYRQALRDIPQAFAAAADVVWPETP
jgi:hypothetical protein